MAGTNQFACNWIKIIIQENRWCSLPQEEMFNTFINKRDHSIILTRLNMEVADWRTACESSSSGLSPKRMPYYPMASSFIIYWHILFQTVSNAWNTLFHAEKHFVSLLGTLCFKAWKQKVPHSETKCSPVRNNMFQRLKRIVFIRWNRQFHLMVL